ncbi:D-Ala-D-Ala carboxypeptidase family metallohydrolase [Kordiimonas aquimaris]|uniref:D-Ala-D-Ala carboxypeptidase family metallohydrolase n=1 Tax=Kordiimonas aquimaris TaxID=707591 RepID=UPI0021D1E6C7|nr:D-Ala-D-Ala carboxypeptidase family metallohydrolase [Kordiimonas aquimaris]
MTYPYKLHPKAELAIDPRMSLSQHFHLHEFTRSQTAEKYDLYNVPREEAEVANLKALSINVLEPVRALFDRYVIITSGFRCATLNRLIGGAITSQHLFGEAADIIIRGVPVCDAALAIVGSGIAFDQLIYEARLRGDAWQEWLHVSHRRLGPNRGEVLTCVQDVDGKRTLAGIQPVVDQTLSTTARSDAGGAHAA